MEPMTKTFIKPSDVDMGPISGEKIVISGMAGLYPESHNVKELSDILYNKINPINTENCRWKYDHPEVAKYTGKVPELNLFDAQFFKVNYRQGNLMDAVGRKFLEQAYQAIYDSGISSTELNGKKICVYVGSCFAETEKACFYAERSRSGLGITGCSKSMFANRISYWLNAKGPSMSIDAACNSSTAALELAYQALTRGECEAAIVGGANISLHPQSFVHYGRMMKLSMDGKTKSFDNDPTGCAKSEAVNILFLQKAKDARRIYAELVHVKSAFTSLVKGEKHPRYGFYRNPSVMAKFIKDFYEEAKIDPEVVEYVEAIGSANADADKAELEALEEVYCNNRSDPLLVGSVISNIGYGEYAIGISAITKVLLAYHTGKIAANLHCEVPRQDVAALREGRMRIVTDHQEFGRKYTAVNGMSVTGVNSHVLLKGHYKPKDLSRYKSSIPQLITISGRQESSVTKILEDIKTRPIDPEELALLRCVHKTSIFGHLGRGYTILDTNDKNETISLSEEVDYFDDLKRPLWFVYSGMGSQWAGMGVQLMRISIFAASIERCRRVLEPKGIDLVHIITSPDKTIFDNILNSFVGIAAIQIGLTDILSEMGIVPDNIIGHSVGELGCAYADGCLTAEEMILAAYSRGLVSLETPFIRGSMAAVGLGFQQISKLCPPEIEIACHNGPDSCTISGPEKIMKDFVADLTSKQIFAKEVPCSNIAYHSRYIAEAGPGLLKYLTEVIKTPKPRSERWLSTSVPQEKWGEPMAKYSSAEYHTNNLLNPVLFEETSTLIPPNAVLVEIAPHGLLQAILKRSLSEACKHIPLTRRGHPDNATFFLEAVGQLYMAGYNPKVEAIYPKIEYPVSTGTPMLSHLVEWAHTEQWNLPVYVAAHRKTAAACKFMLSTHDDDSEYLKGHVIREKNLFPFAAVLVAVWDTLAMSLEIEKKKLSVEFKEVQQYSQIVLYNQRQVTLSVALHRGSGKFEVLGNKIKVATGFIIGNVKGYGKIEPTTTQSDETMVLDLNDIYHLLYSRDYNYSGDFRSIYNANQTLDEANILWKDNWVTFIDGLIQLNALRRNCESVSQLHIIKKIVIDVENHLGHKKILNDGTTVMKAKVNNESISCGGVQMFTSRFYDQPSINKNVAIKSVQFVPHYTTDKLDKKSALYVTLQVVAENLKKQEISVFEIIDNETDKSEYSGLNKMINDIPGIRIQYITVRRCEVLKQRDFLKYIDVVLVNNLSIDENLTKLLLQVRTRNSFLINYDNAKETAKIPSLMLYRTVCAHTTGSMCVELALWHPTVTQMQGIWSGEYYLPIRENPIKGREMMLEIKQPAELDTLYWVEAPETSTDGVKVKVHYAGINDVDVKKKSGFIALDENNENTFLDFSGLTESGERVMGIVYDKSIKTTVRANPDLLWPVPDHWTLEDAATVPLAYTLAFYCLAKGRFHTGISVLVHGGAGALGQAIISIALAHGCQVFTTVSDNKKKQFLLRLFPDLKEEHIVNSRDMTGTDIILNATKGQGVKLLIFSGRGEMKNASFRCCQKLSYVIDTAVIPYREDYNLGMLCLLKGLSYYTLDMYSLLELHETGELKELQYKVSEGIARGFVRPLSRVTYSAPLAPRAYRLQAASRHRGRVLLDLRGERTSVHPQVNCSPNLHQLLFLENDVLGTHLADRLIKRGAKKLIIVSSNPLNYLSFNLNNWKSQGINVELMDSNVLKESLSNIDEKNKCLRGIEGIYYVVSPNEQAASATRNLEQLLLISQISQSTLKYLAIISTGNDCWLKTIVKKVQEHVTLIKLPDLKLDLVNKTNETISVLNAVNAIEQALCSKKRFVIVHSLKQVPQLSLVDEVALITGIQITKDTPRDARLRDLGVDGSKLELVRVHLRDVWLTSLDEEEIDLMTISNFIELGESLSEKDFEDTKGLEAFISYIDCDELLATTEMVLLPTLTNNCNEDDDEFDVNQTYLCVVPGVNGHHSRFRTLCERSKLPALVFQPGLDDPRETIRDIASRFSQTLLKKTKVPNGFYFLGYESGVMVALEMAAIFEDQGFTGTVFCLGGTPKEIKEHFEEKLKDYKTDDEFQNAVIRHMYTLLTKNENTEKLDSLLSNQMSWNEKVTACVNLVSGQVVHSNQYTEELIKAAYGRILEVRRYNYEPRQLRSQLICIRPRSSKIRKTSNLQQYSLKPVIEYELQAPFAFATEDLSCSNIINRHLDPAILEAFEKRNLCESYILSSNLLMSTTFSET